MSGAGETKNRKMELIRRETERTPAGTEAAVRLYWKNGMTWTVYRSGRRQLRGWSSTPARLAANIGRVRKSLLKWIMRPWP
jgi:hypothetical protein